MDGTSKPNASNANWLRISGHLLYNYSIWRQTMLGLLLVEKGGMWRWQHDLTKTPVILCVVCWCIWFKSGNEKQMGPPRKCGRHEPCLFQDCEAPAGFVIESHNNDNWRELPAARTSGDGIPTVVVPSEKRSFQHARVVVLMGVVLGCTAPLLRFPKWCIKQREGTYFRQIQLFSHFLKVFFWQSNMFLGNRSSSK